MFEIPKLSDPMYVDYDPPVINYSVIVNDFPWFLEITAGFCRQNEYPYSSLAMMIQEPLVISEDD